MKSVVVLIVTLLACSVAQALEPYYPSPYADRSWYFSSPEYCWGGPTVGTCKYYGYGKNAVGYAAVTWDVNGVPLSATPCFLDSYQGSPVCPVQPK